MKKLFWIACITFALFSQFLASASSNDLLDDVFDEPQRYDYTSDADADDLFNTQVWIWIDLGRNWNAAWWFLNIGLDWSVIARFAQLLLRLTVILWIPMLMYAGIRIMLSMWDEAKLKESLKHVGMVALGLFVAMMSVAIVYLIISITRSNLWNI